MTVEENNPDIYYTIAEAKSAEIKIKGSRFIADVAHVESRSGAELFLDGIRAKYFDATHHCYAFKIGHSGDIFKFSDDGEPNGSAGKPILFTFDKFGLSDAVAVVTRYFGGIKLGVGGLVRAYQEAAAAAFVLCPKVPVHLTRAVRICCRYEDINAVKRLASKYAVSQKENYTDSVEITAEIHLSEVDKFCDDLYRITNGKVTGIPE